MTKDFKPKQTMADLIKKLQELPQDMPIATYGNPFDEIIIKKHTWEHTNYPYDQPDLDYISLE